MAIAVWLVGPLGSITWLGSLKSHPGAPPTSSKASWPNSPRQGCWLASGSSSSREGQISPPWAPPSQWRDPPALGSGGGTPWGVPRGTPMRLANKEVISVLGRKPISQGREPQPTGRIGFGGWRNIWAYLPRIVPPLSWIPLLLIHPEWGSKSVKKEWQEPHFFASYWRKGRGLHLRHS